MVQTRVIIIKIIRNKEAIFIFSSEFMDKIFIFACACLFLCSFYKNIFSVQFEIKQLQEYIIYIYAYNLYSL